MSALSHDAKIAALESELRAMIAEPTQDGRRKRAENARRIVYLGDDKSNSLSTVGSKRKHVTFAGSSNARSLTDSPDLLALRMGRDWEIVRDYRVQVANRPTMIEYSPAFWAGVFDDRMERFAGWYSQVLPSPAVVSPFDYYGSFHGVETSHTRMIQHALAPNRLADSVA